MKNERLRVPTSTYRIQFNPEFTFADAEKIVPYLHALGVGDLYASPSLTARPGSSHGYDVARANEVSRDLGGEAGFASLAGELRALNMGLLLDIVPNHMAATIDNPWWADLLEHGKESRFARFFDIDWDPSIGKGTLSDKILLPILGQIYGLAVESGEIRLALTERGFVVRYYELELPVAKRSYHRLTGETGDGPAVWARYQKEPAFRRQVDQALARVNGRKEAPESFVELDAILEEQAYRLAYWRRAADEINYRRFFDITDLVGVRVEEKEVYEERHRLLFEMVRRGLVTGLRIDHIDGLYDPQLYLDALQFSTAPEWKGDPASPAFYVVVEKILAADEFLPGQFATSGTSGYDYLNVLNNVFVEPRGLREIDRAYKRFTGMIAGFEELAYDRKKQVLDELFWGDVRRLGDHLLALARDDRYARDVQSRQIIRAFVELTAHLTVYRTYTRSDDVVRDEDRHYIERAFEKARATPFLSRRAVEFVRRVLLLEPPAYATSLKKEWLDFVMRWQQLTGRVTAKGVEDTAFYIYNRLISMNEVGGEPGVSVASSADAFHQFNQQTVDRWPHGMNATSTHDTKRSEDVRARINVLSEIPDRWEKSLRRWSRMNARLKKEVAGRTVPGPNEEVLIYQTLLGMWPLERSAEKHLPSRIENFVIKASREAKTFTRWTRPDEEYERALVEFAQALVKRRRFGWFSEFIELQQYVSHFGAINALSQLVLKTMSPGVPDFYQGTEIWNFSVVDPDNRRPVDYGKRVKMLADLERLGDAPDLLKNWQDGRVKMFVTRALLQLRRVNGELFRDGGYEPLRARGERARHIVGFTRAHEGEAVVVAVPRFATQLVAPPKFPLGKRVWGDTRVQAPAGELVSVFTGAKLEAERGSFRAADLFEDFPVFVGVAL